MRKAKSCVNCGETREMVNDTLCSQCYQKNIGAAKASTVDRHNPGLRREDQKLLRGYMNALLGLSEIGVQRADLLKIVKIIEPYLVLVSQYFPASVHSRTRAGMKDPVQPDVTRKEQK